MKGYSLLELLVTMVVVLILICLAQPMWEKLYYSIKSYEQVNRIVRSLNFARSIAIIKSKPVMVCPTGASIKTCGGDWQKGMNIYLVEAPHLKLIQTVADFPKAVIQWNRPSKKIIFAGNGWLESQNGSFNYTIRGHEKFPKRIVISVTGRTRIE